MYKSNTQEKRRLRIGIAPGLSGYSRVLFHEAEYFRSLHTAARIDPLAPSRLRWKRHGFQLTGLYQPDHRIPAESQNLGSLIDRVPLLGYDKIDKHRAPRLS